MVAGNCAIGAADRIIGSHKRAVIFSTALLFAALAMVALFPQAPLWQITALFTAVGFFRSTFPAVIAHGRAF
jgi:predicted MFS family arabinose efflux permease